MRLFAIAKASEEVDDPGTGPAGVAATVVESIVERFAGGIEQFGGFAAGNLVAGCTP